APVPRPDKNRNSQLLAEIGPASENLLVANRISASVTSTMTVRISVARSGLMSSTPTLANIAVSAANTADSTAQTCHEEKVSGLIGPRSVAVFRQHRQRRYLDAFVDQRARLVGRGLAIDRAMFLVAVVHRPRFVRKTFADIVGVLDDVVAQFLDLGAQLALLGHHQRGRLRGRRFRRRSGFHLRRRRRLVTALLADDARRHDGLFHLDRAAYRASH